jgi:protein-disulfide isomerase
MFRSLLISALLLSTSGFAQDPKPDCDCAHDSAPSAGERAQLDLEGAPSRGPSDAKVTIAVFSDFQCPFCRRGEAVLQRVLEKYGDKVRVVFLNRPLPMHAHARLAATAALAAGEQGHFWEFHDWLFSGQATLDRDGLLAEAGRLGLDTARFTAALDSGRFDARIDADVAQATKLGVAGTPTFFVNGERIVGAQADDVFSQQIDAELAR